MLRRIRYFFVEKRNIVEYVSVAFLYVLSIFCFIIPFVRLFAVKFAYNDLKENLTVKVFDFFNN